MNEKDNPFIFLEDFDVAHVAQILSNELPFVAGAALSRTSALFNAKVMANMPDSIRNEIASAISKYRSIPAEVLYDIAEELEKKLNKPGSKNFDQQKKSLLANLDLGAIMQDINNLKTKKKQPPNSRANKPEPVESRIIKPEEYDAYLRGDTSNNSQNNNKSAHQSNIVNPSEFIPENHNLSGKTPISNSGTNNEMMVSRQLNPETKKELALQQALLHTRSKKQETRITPKSPVNSAKTNGKNYKAQKIDGMALAAHILRESSPELRKLVMDQVPDLYNKLNDRMFDFADLEHSNRDAIGKIFTGLEPEISALALRFASDELKNTALTSVSRRKATLIIDEFKRTASAKVRLTDIEDAQQEVIDYAIMLQNRGEIIIDPSDSSIV